MEGKERPRERPKDGAPGRFSVSFAPGRKAAVGILFGGPGRQKMALRGLTAGLAATVSLVMRISLASDRSPDKVHLLFAAEVEAHGLEQAAGLGVVFLDPEHGPVGAAVGAPLQDLIHQAAPKALAAV